MKNTGLKIAAGSALGAAALACPPASAMDILARVISSTPVVQQVAVPRQVCSNEAVVTQAPKSGAGALMGAVAGGAAGNAIGHGGGRAAATMLGLLGGALMGDRIEGPNNQVQNVQQCTTQTFYENRAMYYNVVYEYQGTRYNAQMPSDPGQYVRLQVTPVGALPSAPPPSPAQAYPQQPQNYPQPQAYPQQPQNYPPAPAYQPQTYYQPAPVQQIYVQPVLSAPLVYPAYYSRPYYAPYYAPVGLSLNFGYSRSYGGGGGWHHHHRR